MKIILIILLLFKITKASVPEISNHPIDTSVIRGEPVTLECRASGSPIPLIEWFKDGVRLKQMHEGGSAGHRLQLPEGSLFFLRAIHTKKESDSGVYHCVASNENGVVRSQNATLRVAYIRDEFKTLPKDTDAIVGRDAILHCGAPMGVPTPVIKWKKDGDSLDLTSAKRIKIDASGNLVIKSVNTKDQGRYQCAAGNLAGKKITKPVRLEVNEPPYFLNSPKDVKAVKGEDVFIECQVGGDPYPAVTWTKDHGDIDISKVKIVSGKGLRIKSVESSDRGRYICTAKNKAGILTASSLVSVSEPPKINIPPPSNIQVVAGQTIKLPCSASGSPYPDVFWSKEDGSLNLLKPGGRQNNGVKVSSEGSLVMENSIPESSGYYICVAVNEAGSEIRRSHVLVIDPMDLRDPIRSEVYHVHSSLEMEEARLASLETKVEIIELLALSPSSLKIKWNFVSSPTFLDGFLVRYGKAGSEYDTRSISYTGATSFVLDNLDEHQEYKVFLQPYFKSILGKPGSIKKILTHPDVPSEAPKIIEASRINSTTVFLSWNPIPLEHLNGPLRGYEILIRGNDTSVNNTVAGDGTNEATLIVNGMSMDKIYTIQISVLNSAGRGPYSAPLEIYKGSGRVDFFPHTPNEISRTTWIIALIGAATFILIFLSGIFFYKRKIRDPGNKSLPGYLPAGTEEFHCRLYQAKNDRLANGLWIDRRWNTGDYEKASNSSEKKLLPSSSEGEYAYVDKHNLSSFTASSGASDHKNLESPEPYATTDIFQHHLNRNIGGTSKSCCSGCTYADPIPQRRYGESHSCDDLLSDSRRVNNILDMIPPPPINPPPPSSYDRSQENVISPKYLFSHPVYQSCNSHHRSKSSTPRSKRKIKDSKMTANNRLMPREAFGAETSRIYQTPKPPLILKKVQDSSPSDLQNELDSFNKAVLELKRRSNSSDELRIEPEYYYAHHHDEDEEGERISSSSSSPDEDF